MPFPLRRFALLEYDQGEKVQLQDEKRNEEGGFECRILCEYSRQPKGKKGKFAALSTIPYRLMVMFEAE
jgi:hypothetical protein